jgi:hypothetical protein
MKVKDLIKALQALPPKWQEFPVMLDDMQDQHLYGPTPVTHVNIRDEVKGRWKTHIEISATDDSD